MPACDSVISGFSQFFITISFGELCFNINISVSRYRMHMWIVYENRNDGVNEHFITDTLRNYEQIWKCYVILGLCRVRGGGDLTGLF